GTASRRVDVLNPQQQASTRSLGEVGVQQRRIGVAEMQITVRARRKTENGWHGLATLVIAALDAAIHFSRLCYDRRWMAGSSPAMTIGENLRSAMTVHLNSQADLEDAIRALVKQDKRLKPILDITGMPALRRREPGFTGLAHIVTGQQLST